MQSTLKYAELLDKAVAKNDKDAIQDEQARCSEERASMPRAAMQARRCAWCSRPCLP